MASIKTLPEAVRNSVRSGIFVFDLARVVEELIYNSLDAGATKVSVFIGIGTCYVKVVDDGSGITRDGLVLLGERYATSKSYFVETDSATECFGYRGEALGSISDVSLIEIVTKAHGRPNGYRKVLKGCKCLYLGIDDDMQNVGTTVTVRDLFYNQPVRRKHMQSSPKKTLHSVRKSVLYIALLHSNVSFDVIDIESEEKLLSAESSCSPLSLLASSFGIETSKTLHQLNLSNGILELSGYMSIPYETMSVKVLQCVYINARYVCNCLIHKLLNELATKFKYLDSVKVDYSLEPNMKKNRSQAYANYIFNLSCPRSRYDLSFEPSKTTVEFKDWVPILTFIERVVTQFWCDKTAQGKTSSRAADILQKDDTWEENDRIASPRDDILVECNVSKKPRRIENIQAYAYGDHSPPMNILTRENKHLLDTTGCRVPYQNMPKKPAQIQDEQTEKRFSHQMKYSCNLFDGSPAKGTSIGNRDSDNHLLTLDDNPDILGNYRHFTEFSFGSMWKKDFPDDDPKFNRGSTRALSHNCFMFLKETEEPNKDFRKPFLQRCSTVESLPPEVDFFATDETLEYQHENYRRKRKQRDPHDMIDDLGIDDGSDQRVDMFVKTRWHNVAVTPRTSVELRSNYNVCKTDVDFSRDIVKSNSFDDEYFVEDNDFSLNIASGITKFTSIKNFLNCEGHNLPSDSLLGSTSSYVDVFAHENARIWDIESSKHDMWGDFARTNNSNCMLSYEPIMMADFNKESHLTSTCISDSLDFDGYACSNKDIRKKNYGHISDDIFSPRYSDTLASDPDWSCLNTFENKLLDSRALSPICTATPDHLSKNNQSEVLRYNKCEQYRHGKRISRRSQSAPPFYTRKKLFSLKDHFTIGAEVQNAETRLETTTCQEASEVQQFSGACYMYSKNNSGKDLLVDVRAGTEKMPHITSDENEVQVENFEESPLSGRYITGAIKEFIPNATEEHNDSRIKSRNSYVQNNKDSHDVQHQCNVLNITSGILHLASDSLVPEISKKCLEDTKVLQQVDKKFIPVVASGTLVIIDQHAADERIRLEELRHKVLSGEMKTITYLDTEQELVLPEIGYQLLLNYVGQIQHWGWNCNIHAQDNKSFARNMNLLQKQPAVVTLLTVPCILGVKLSDMDLLEFLQQLADTDGSSIMPPSVHRVLNSKACRGAIMFGDALLPSECSLIVEELKKTSLCFQCAHGRPTTIPLVNLETLHRQINKLVLINDGGSNESSWHGFRRQKISSKRAAERLASAKG